MSIRQPLLEEAARTGAPLYFDHWEKNPGVIELRKIHRETRPNTGGRMSRVPMAMVHVKSLWQQMSGGIQGMAIPKPMKTAMNAMFERLRTDKQFAIKVYNTFPQLADRYGYGMQANGRPRLSFVRLIDDPLARELLR